MQDALCILSVVHMSQEGPGQIQVDSPVDPEGMVHLTADGHLLPAHQRHLARFPYLQAWRTPCLGQQVEAILEHRQHRRTHRG